MPTVSNASRFNFSTRRPQLAVQHLLAQGLTAVLLACSFPHPGWSVLAWVALVPAGIAAVRTRSWRRLFITAAVVSAVWWGLMLRWMWPVTGPGVGVLAVYLGLNVGLALLAAGALVQKLRWPMMAALPLCWVGVEALRSVAPAGGFAWFTLAHSQAPWADGSVGRVAQSADLLGQHTVGLVVAVVNGALVDLATRRAATARVSLGVAGLTLAGALGYGQWRMTQAAGTAGPAVVVAVVQTSVPHSNKLAPTIEGMASDFSGLVELHGQAVRAIKKRVGTKDAARAVVVWPETVVPTALNPAAAAAMRAAANDTTQSQGYRTYHQVRQRLAELVPQAVARDGVPTFVGASFRGQGGRPRHNAVYALGADGAYAAAPYFKQHLVPMGEYVPGPGFVKKLVLKFSPYGEDVDHTIDAGTQAVVFDLPPGGTGPLRVATPICFEDAVAGVCRDMVYGGDGRSEGQAKRVDVLLNLTNDGWFTGTGQRHQQLGLAALRCIENRVPMARSVNTGISGFIDSSGRPHDSLDAFTAGVSVAQVVTDTRVSPYGRIGGWPWVLFVLLAIGAGTFAALFGRPLARHRIA